MKKLCASILFFLFNLSLFSQQQQQQYFDGADTIYDPSLWTSSILLTFEPDTLNTWQIGIPQKSIFDSAATIPNALLTDTLLAYPSSDSSSFLFTIYPILSNGILAIQWKQQLDFEPNLDGGLIEFSFDGGQSWESAFDNPFVYNFYGYQSNNEDTLLNGSLAFTGTDSTWRDIWLCYDLTWLSIVDSVQIKFTLLSDSVQNNREGWIIDNLLTHITLAHTINERALDNYFNVYPNPAQNRIQIDLKKVADFHIIEEMQLLTIEGQILKEWRNIPTKFFIDLDDFPNNQYFLKIKTNLDSEVIPILMHKK